MFCSRDTSAEKGKSIMSLEPSYRYSESKYSIFLYFSTGLALKNSC